MTDIVTKKAAKAGGLKYYFTGLACKRSHVGERFTSCGTCVECSAEKSRVWYSNKPRAAAKRRKWRNENKDQERRTRQVWAKKNPEKMKAATSRYKKSHPGATQASCRKWYNKNVDGQRKRSLEYRNSRIESAREKSRKYNKENREVVAAIARTRRARKMNNGGKHTAADIAAIFRAQRGKCGYCRDPLDKTRHVDHIMPLALGGSNDRTNLQLPLPTLQQDQVCQASN